MTYPGSGGAFKLMLGELNSNSGTHYAFNNIVYGNTSGNIMNVGGQYPRNFGTWNVFNNTIQCGRDSETGSCANDGGGVAGMTVNFNFRNNHWITSASSPVTCTYGTCTFTANLTQTVAVANGQGYTSGQANAFFPINTTNSTVSAGTNQQSLCMTIASIDSAAGIACQNDTTYAVGYNTSNHTVIAPARSVAPRPSSNAWDIGAYQYSSGGTPPPVDTTPPLAPTGVIIQ